MPDYICYTKNPRRRKKTFFAATNDDAVKLASKEWGVSLESIICGGRTSGYLDFIAQSLRENHGRVIHNRISETEEMPTHIYERYYSFGQP